ncbi:MAG: XRE family transcriptional regulator [Deltaproteobacteria bacterium]|nr:XRE family transcriptional regulator [Deltaproteobacteria bacterium]
MNQSEIDIGAKIRLYRKRKRLSLSRLSEITGIAASNLSSIELNKTSPTLNTLAKIADAFEVRISELLNGIFYDKVLVCGLNDLKRSKKPCRGIIERHLTADAILNKIEVKSFDFSPGSGPICTPPENTERFMLVLKGALILDADHETIELNEGQGAYLTSHTEARLTNNGKISARLLIIHSSG